MVANNLLYKNIEINHYLLHTWEDKFIAFGIIDSIVHSNANQHERECYATDINNGNFENDFDVARAGTSIERDHINSCCIYNDIDDQRQNLLYDYCPQLPILNLQSHLRSTDINYYVLLHQWSVCSVL